MEDSAGVSGRGTYGGGDLRAESGRDPGTACGAFKESGGVRFSPLPRAGALVKDGAPGS